MCRLAKFGLSGDLWRRFTAQIARLVPVLSLRPNALVNLQHPAKIGA